jgi:sigma-B regulation protein RsbU (phosphoserine phosphatase)
MLERGGTLFLYTDGVPEAADEENRLFGTERTLQALNGAPQGSPKELLAHVKEAVDRFAGGAPQFDDLTMLAVTRK